MLSGVGSADDGGRVSARIRHRERVGQALALELHEEKTPLVWAHVADGDVCSEREGRMLVVFSTRDIIKPQKHCLSNTLSVNAKTRTAGEDDNPTRKVNDA